MPEARHFTPATFRFLRDVAANNDRDWFQANKQRYEDELREPALQFIRDFEPHLHEISPHFLADDRKVGGSLFRIYRDVRFSKDKSPYKTYTGVQFRHEMGKDAHCPGFYLHLQPRQVFVGVGIWQPDGETLRLIRDAIVARPDDWKATVGHRRFQADFDLGGDSLVRGPRGYDPDHPLIEDLKRKDFIAVRRLTQKAVTAPGFVGELAEHCGAGAPLVEFLCRAIDVPF